MVKVAAFFVLLAIAAVNADNHYIDDCLYPGTAPTIFYNQEISKEAEFLQYQEQTIRIPATGFTPAPITCISVVNKGTDEDGGYPYLKDGGVGFTYATIYFKSQLSKGFDFQVALYYDAPTTTTDAATTTAKS